MIVKIEAILIIDLLKNEMIKLINNIEKKAALPKKKLKGEVKMVFEQMIIVRLTIEKTAVLLLSKLKSE